LIADCGSLSVNRLLRYETTFDEHFQPVQRFICFLFDGSHLRNEVRFRLRATSVALIRPDTGAALDELSGNLCRHDIRRKISDQRDHIETTTPGAPLKFLLVHAERLSNRGPREISNEIA
jgi:hypothetical protein